MKAPVLRGICPAAQKRRSAKLLWAAGIVLFALLAACAGRPESPTRIGAIVWPGYECFFLARSLGYFEGKAVKLVTYPSSPEVIRAFQNRSIEAACMSADEFLRLAQEESGLRAVLLLDISNGADALIARKPGTAIHDLRGKRIGVEVNAQGVYFLSRALATGGLKPKDVEIVPLENDKHVYALKQGEVDAVVTSEPHRGALLDDGAFSVFDSSRLPGEVFDVLVVRESVIAERSDRLKAIIGDWFKARQYLLDHPEEAAKIIARHETISPLSVTRALTFVEMPSIERNREMFGPGKVELLRQFNALRTNLAEFDLIGPDATLQPSAIDGSLLP